MRDVSLARFSDAKVAVIGDIMIDVYLSGEVLRISPEAPVPVVHWQSETSSPGGAANVAANIASLGARAVLVGIVGDDGGLERLRPMLAKIGAVDFAGVLRDPSRGTTQKTRVLGQRQIMLRIDREDMRALSPAIESELIDRAIMAIDRSDLVVLSDYGKGALTDRLLARAIGHARAAGKTVIVDPKGRDFSRYAGASIVTPNRAELVAATGIACETDAQAAQAAAQVRAVCGADVLLTLSERGMSFFAGEAPPLRVPTVAREVFDVSGAGDTVVAALATALAAGLAVAEAIALANRAAGIVVGRVGTSRVTRAELAQSLVAGDAGEAPDGGLLALPQLLSLSRSWKARGLKVGVANGCFDLLHPGHVALVRQAAAACDRLIVALNTDASARRLKGPTRPVQCEGDRAEVVGAIKGVAAVALFDEDTPYELIKAVQPDLLVKGADYKDREVAGADIVRGAGGTVLLARLVEGRSTTRLLAGAPARETAPPR